ncbi:DNA polymerase Y family protein [Brassicibacter mesophilus]|uniref:DNA polymerase Y family protein n=1 Tax=Brassicibacter mesophilus TaxID=745119 RepID=UPI003D1ACFD7
MSKVIFHIDVNSAYLSWEAVYRLQQGDELDLRTIPSAVGGDPKKRNGIILTKSIPAKKYGIKTGETLFEAFKKCPNLYVVPPSYDLYIKCSNAMVEVLQDYSPKIQRYSVDECFLDYTNMEGLFGDPIETAHIIKERIKNELGFTVSIGVSSNKLLAKMGSDLKKPDAVTTIFPEEMPSKMWCLPVEDLFMVGRATAPKLHKLGIETIGDLANFDLNLLKYKLKSHGVLIWNYANGVDNSEVRKSNRIEIKGIGNSTTAPFDIDNYKEAHMILLSLCETVGMRLRDSGYCSRLVSVGIKTSDFGYYSHQHKFDTPTDCTQQIYEHAKDLFNESWKGEKIRHLGVRVSEFCDNDMVQLSIFDSNNEKQRAIDTVVDKIRMKYDSRSIIRSCFLNSGIKPLMGGVGEDDYPLMSSIL